MANLKISQLPAATTPVSGSELVPIVQGGVTSKVSISDLFTFSSNFTLSGTAVELASSIDVNAASATVLQTPRDIGGVSFDGSSSVTPRNIEVNQYTFTPPSGSAYLLFSLDSGTAIVSEPYTNSGLLYDPLNNILTANAFVGGLNGTADSAYDLVNILSINKGGTGADLSSTGGTSQVVKQETLGGVFTVSQLSASDLSNGTSGSGKVILEQAPHFLDNFSLENTFQVSSAGNSVYLSGGNSLIGAALYINSNSYCITDDDVLFATYVNNAQSGSPEYSGGFEFKKDGSVSNNANKFSLSLNSGTATNEVLNIDKDGVFKIHNIGLFGTTASNNLTYNIGNSASSWAGTWANLSVNSNSDVMWGINTKIDNSASVVVKTVNSHPDIKGGCLLWGGNGNPYGENSLVLYVPPGSGTAGNETLTPNGLFTADVSNNMFFGVNKVTGISHNLDVGGDMGAYRLAGTSAAPTIAAGAGAGTTPTVSIGSNSTDMAGIVNVTTGTTPSGTNATIATITFNTTYGTSPFVQLQPANAITALLSGVTMVYVTETTTTFAIISGTTALTAATAYKWKYHVIQ